MRQLISIPNIWLRLQDEMDQHLRLQEEMGQHAFSAIKLFNVTVHTDCDSNHLCERG